MILQQREKSIRIPRRIRRKEKTEKRLEKCTKGECIRKEVRSLGTVKLDKGEIGEIKKDLD